MGAMPHSSSAPAAGFTPTERALVYRLLAARRDIREFRPDPVPPAVLRRILVAAHQAPSVGLMQPWSFIVLTDLPVRQQIKSLFETANQTEAARLDPAPRAALYRRLKLEGILEAPLNLAVTCDHRRGAPFVLGRGPVPATDRDSTCLAIENLWLAARAEGVGVGWVSILDYAAVERLLGVPAGVELIAYLCVGYPREFREIPMLEEVGWSTRLPLEEVIYAERWGTPANLVADPAESS